MTLLEPLLILALPTLTAYTNALRVEARLGPVAWKDPGGWRFPPAELAGLRGALLAWAVIFALAVLLEVSA